MDYRNVYKKVMASKNIEEIPIKNIYEQTLNVFIDIINNMNNMSFEWLLKEEKRLHLGIILVIISMIFYFLQDF
jgi:hypothetical protein